MTTATTEGRGKEGVLLPLLVDKALRAVEKRMPREGAALREHMERAAAGAAPASTVRVFPSARRYLADAAVRETPLTAGKNGGTVCARPGCGRPALIFNVGGIPVASHDECVEHARGKPTPRAAR